MTEIESFLNRDLDHSQRSVLRTEARVRTMDRHCLGASTAAFTVSLETGRSFDEASERFDQLRAQRNVLVADFDPILLDHCTHLVLGSGGLRDLHQDVSLAKDTIAEAEVYAKRVEEALRATKGQEERAKEFVASLRKNLTAHRRHSEEFKSYAGDLESRLEEKEALIRELEEKQRRLKERNDQLELAIHEGVAYAKSLESEIEGLRIQEKEVASHMQMLESDIEKHRILEKEVKGYVRNLEAQLAEYKPRQLESARYIQGLLSQPGEPGTQLPDLDAVPGRPAGGRIRGSQAPSDRDQDYD